MELMLKLFGHSNLLKNLVVRDLKHRYVGSMGGFLWAVIQPLVLLVSYSFVFQVIFKQQVDTKYVNYPIFLLCGILPWTFFSDTVLRSCGTILENKTLITKTIMPAEILPLSIALSSLVLHGVGMGVLLAILVLFHSIPLSVFGVLIYLPIVLMFSMGLGWFVAGLQVFLRDTIQALQIFMTLWFFLTPIFYPIERITDTHFHGNAQYLLALNPLLVVVNGYRSSMLGLPHPPMLQIAIATAVSLAVFVAGGWIFRRTKSAFADVL